MGWAHCGTFEGREIGYGIEATCDFEGCETEIDRGLSYVCGTTHGGDDGCGGYFCGDHLVTMDHEEPIAWQLCPKCEAEHERLEEGEGSNG
jgi:hypothetical protein